jgi:hypothetical protein
MVLLRRLSLILVPNLPWANWAVKLLIVSETVEIRASWYEGAEVQPLVSEGPRFLRLMNPHMICECPWLALSVQAGVRLQRPLLTWKAD